MTVSAHSDWDAERCRAWANRFLAGADEQRSVVVTAANRDFNAKWIQVHLAEGHPLAAERRREVVAECERWIAALDAVGVGCRP